LKLKDRVCLITGAGRGIGRTMAVEFAGQGATVFLNDINPDDVDGTLNLLKSNGAICYSYIADVGKYDEVRAMYEYIYKNSDTLDILVNNAAILRDKTLHNMDIKYHWDDVIRINLTGVFYCCKEAIVKMRENKFGRIINMTSVIGLCGNFGQTAYGAAKAGVIGFTKSLAHEAALKGITVNAIAPGFIETEMIKDIPAEVREKIESRIPMGKFGCTEDIAKLAAFIASDEAGYITGQVFNINGGFLMP
jgi:NAD(P)-dependent dehydrogenase (short-subunit alcohol dehydrogenase family)